MEYYAAINRSNSAGESTYFIEFMLRMIRDTLAELVNTQKSETVYLNGEKDSLEGKILVLFASDEHLTAGEAATLLNVSQRQIERAIAALKKKGKLTRIGANRNGSWKALPQIYLPVTLSLQLLISSTVPWATMRPPASPPPGPMSMI